MLEAQLRGRFAYAAADRADQTLTADGPSAADVAAQSSAAPLSFLGRLPCAAPALAAAIDECCAALEGSALHHSAATVGGTVPLANAVVAAYAAHSARLSELYDLVAAALAARGVDLAALKVVAMVCAGGTPFREYGLGDSLERAVDAQVELACKYGIVFDLVPALFSDFDHNIARMGVGLGAVLLAAQRRRDRAGGRLDGVLFACKGTLAAALGTRAYAAAVWDSATASPSGGERLALIGMGTDLSQGICDVDATWAAAVASVVTINSIQDANVGGAGRAALEAFSARWAAASSTTAASASAAAPLSGVVVTDEWVDVDAHQDVMFAGHNPCHSWYPSAFVKPHAAPLKARLLSRFAAAVGARQPAGVVNDALSPASQAAARHAATVAKLAAGPRACDEAAATVAAATVVAPAPTARSVLGELGAFNPRVLRATETKVVTVPEWIGASKPAAAAGGLQRHYGSMFMSE